MLHQHYEDNNRQMLIKAVESATNKTFTLASKGETIEYYKDTYGLKNWKSELAMAISGTSDKKSTPYKSAIRHFQGDRADKIGSKKWAAIADRLSVKERTLKNETITITIQGTQGMGGGKHREKTVTVKMSGDKAKNFVNNPSYAEIYEEYLLGGEDLFEDGEYELQVVFVSIA